MISGGTSDVGDHDTIRTPLRIQQWVRFYFPISSPSRQLLLCGRHHPIQYSGVHHDRVSSTTLCHLIQYQIAPSRGGGTELLIQIFDIVEQRMATIWASLGMIVVAATCSSTLPPHMRARPYYQTDLSAAGPVAPCQEMPSE